MSSPKGREQSDTSVQTILLITGQILSSLSSNGDSANILSEANFVSCRDELSSNCSIKNESLSATQVDEILRGGNEPLNNETADVKVDSKEAKRTALPSSRNHSPSSSSATEKKTSDVNKSYSVAKRGTRWTTEEKALLLRLKSKHKSWVQISEQLPGRSVIACVRHYAHTARRNPPVGKTSTMRASATPMSWRRTMWTLEEVKLLIKLRKRRESWKRIGEQFAGRSLAACRRKWETLMRRESAALETKDADEAESSEDSTDDDDEASGDGAEGQIFRRGIAQQNYPNNGDEEMSDGDIDKQSRIEWQASGSINGDKHDKASEDSSGSESESESESENEEKDVTEKMKRKYHMFLVHH